MIRSAKMKDFQDIHRLNKEGLGYDYPVDQTKRRLRTVLSMPTNMIFVAEIDEKVVGYIHISAYECTYCDSMKNIQALVVDESYRKHGIGQELLRTAEEWAKFTGAKGVRLSSGSNRLVAHQFYTGCGYTYRKMQKNFVKFF